MALSCRVASRTKMRDWPWLERSCLGQSTGSGSRCRSRIRREDWSKQEGKRVGSRTRAACRKSDQLGSRPYDRSETCAGCSNVPMRGASCGGGGRTRVRWYGSKGPARCGGCMWSSRSSTSALLNLKGKQFSARALQPGTLTESKGTLLSSRGACPGTACQPSAAPACVPAKQEKKRIRFLVSFVTTSLFRRMTHPSGVCTQCTTARTLNISERRAAFRGEGSNAAS